VVHPGGIKTNIARSARTGAYLEASSPTAEAELKRSIAEMERFFITPPEEAARRILCGVKREEGRILVGPDAAQADPLQRLLPATGGSSSGWHRSEPGQHKSRQCHTRIPAGDRVICSCPRRILSLLLPWT